MTAYFYWYCFGPVGRKAPFHVKRGAWDTAMILRKLEPWND